MAGITILCGLYIWHWKDLGKAYKSFWGVPHRPEFNIPVWWNMLYLAWISITYTLSGFNKLSMAGLDWANGASLQLWLVDLKDHAWGLLGRLLNDYIASHHLLANISQFTIFAVELTCFLILPFRNFRLIYGVVLAGFHLICNFTMGFHFWGAIGLNSYVLIYLPLRDRLKSNAIK